MANDSGIVSIKTTPGEYDIGAVLHALPASQRPDLFVARIDSSGMNFPRNVAQLPCRKVLVVGDTHHLTTPIGRLVAYALTERYDAVILDYTRQHAHFFVEAGLSNVHWLPGFNVRDIPAPAPARRRRPFTMIGQVGKHHFRRRALCQLLIAQGLPLQIMRAPTEAARIVHARSLVNLNCSLNGDLNLRVFEVLASGGFLLTDRLAPEAGLDILFQDEQHLVTFANAADCVDKARALIADDARTAAVAREGQRRYEAEFSPQRIVADFMDLVDGRPTRPEFAVSREPRATQPPVPRQTLMNRIAIYEALQDFQARREVVKLLADPGIDPAIISDLVDLPRIDIVVGGESKAQMAHLERLGLRGRVTFSPNIPRSDFAIVATTVEGWRGGFADISVHRNHKPFLLLTDNTHDQFMQSDLATKRLEAGDTKLIYRSRTEAAR